MNHLSLFVRGKCAGGGGGGGGGEPELYVHVHRSDDTVGRERKIKL